MIKRFVKKGKTYIGGVNSIIHNIGPPLENCHLEQGEVGLAHVIKVYVAVDPGEIVVDTSGHVRHNVGVHRCTKLVYTLVKKTKE